MTTITNPNRTKSPTTTTNADDIWRQIVEEDRENRNLNLITNHHPHQQQPLPPPPIAVTYHRLKPQHSIKSNESLNTRDSVCSNESRVSFVVNPQRVSWNRSLSTRGRTSIAIIAVPNNQGKQQRCPRRGPKPPLPKGKFTELPNFEKERAYFQEVDADELLEESPSPKKFAWVMGDRTDSVTLPPLCTRLEKWLHGRRQHKMGSSLSTILRTPDQQLDPIPYDHGMLGFSSMGKTEELCLQSICGSGSAESRYTEAEKANSAPLRLEDKDFDDIESEIRKLSFTQRPSSLATDSFLMLLKECRQSAPSTLLEVFAKLCDPGSITKIGEGTYGEAFIAGGSVCKIVPVDGELRVNGEIQKRSIELLEEVILSLTLNRLRGPEVLVDNATTTFIQTKDIRVCQGPYDPALVKAWEAWDVEHVSENDHPNIFPENQCYVVSVLEHGGADLESFVLHDFNEAQSLLVQVTAALAVAEAAFQFEHRDLHWGNILLSRKETNMLPFTLEGKKMSIRTHGLLVSIIDFTLSRINTGNTILYLNLSSDPELFEGPKGDKQSETYRRMREVTDDCWEGSFPKTNVLWLQYLVDILLLKKSFKRSARDERELRSLKKRFNSYDSAKEALFDPFLSSMLCDNA